MMDRRGFLGSAIGLILTARSVLARSRTVELPPRMIVTRHHFGDAFDFINNATEAQLRACYCIYYTTQYGPIFKSPVKYAIRTDKTISLEIEPLNISRHCTVTGVAIVHPNRLNLTESINRGNQATFQWPQAVNPGDTLKVNYHVEHNGERWSHDWKGK